ncbi:MAG TPA: right-handed parallel beta-helix repeat-containing protein, partial [Thermomicrobiales bacterium]|nr:right-handed parallel beta-helix repeat-containing protein [Thermomicrobiales bacterium]
MSNPKTSSSNPSTRWPSLAEIFFGRLANLWRKRRMQRTFAGRRLQFQAIEPRILLSADFFVDNPGDYLVTNDQGIIGLSNGDTVTWNPGAGSAHGGPVSALTFGVNAFGRIQDAINAAAPGDTLRVAGGTFSELVTVNKSVEVLGNQFGVDARTRAVVPESIVNGADFGGGHSTSFNVTASNVEIDGFTVQQATSATQFGTGILLGAGISGSQIHNNIIQNNITGLYLANGAGNQAVIEQNLFLTNNVAGPVSGTGIYTDQFVAGGTVSNVLIDNNTFVGNTGQAIFFSSTNAAAPATNIVVSNNLFDVNGRALVAFNLATSQIVGNTMRNSTDSATADIRLFEGVNDLSITGNVLQNGAGQAVRISNIGTGSPSATDVSFTLNSLSGYTGPSGAFGVDAGGYTGILNATGNWWGSSTGPTTAANPGGTGLTLSDPFAVVDFQPWLLYGDFNDSAVGFQIPATFTVAAQTDSFTATNNNYRRMVNAIESLQPGQTLLLSGVFDWTEANASAAWALGNDGTSATVDDFTLTVRPNLNNAALTAASLGSARIQGPGDLAGENLEGFLVFNGGDNQNWTISNLEIFDFDLSIGMFNGAGGSDAYNGTQIVNNLIRVPADLNTTVAPADANQNIGIHFSFGQNQTIQNNEIQLAGNGVSDSANNRFASSVGMQSNVSGGAVYDGLLIDNNTLNILNAQSADPERILGIWENAHGHSSDITVSNNDFFNDAAGNDPSTNRQSAFRVTSHSSATTVAAYTGNTVDGANIGFEWLTGNNFAGNAAVRLWQNTITNSHTGVLIQSSGMANLFQNSITGSGVAGVDVVSGTLTSSGPVSNAVQENFISGGAGHAIRVGATAGAIGAIFNNDLSGNAGLGVNNLSATLVNASGNWWGTHTPAGVAAEVSANVDYTPWLDVGTDTSATAGFQGSFDAFLVGSDGLGAGNLTLRLNGTDVEFLDDGVLVNSRSLALLTDRLITVNGTNAQTETLLVDYAFGGFFEVDVSFNGGTGAADDDALAVTGGTFTTVTHTFTTTGPEHSGSIVYDASAPAQATISYTGLEPIDMTGSTIANLVFNLPGTNDLAILEDDLIAANGVSQIRSQASTPTFDTTTFSNPTSSLTVNMGGDGGSFTVGSLPDFIAALTINGQAGADTVNFTGTAGFNSLSVTVGGSITDASTASLAVVGNAALSGSSITLGDSAGNVVNFGSLTFTGGAVSITEDSDTVITGINTASSLSLVTASSITDAPGTSLTVSGNARFSGNNITFGDNPADTTNFGSLTVFAGGNVNIREDSSLEISGANLAQTLILTAEAGAITDTSDADITATGDAILTANGAGGAITLGDQATNDDNFNRLTFNSVGVVSISEDSSTILAGSSTASALSLVTNGSISDSAATSLTVAGNARFSASSTIILGNDDTLNFGTLGFNSTTTVSVREDSAMEIAGVNTAGTLLLTTEAGAITDANDADIAVTGAAILRADGTGGAITLGDEANNLDNFGTVTFNSIGHVSISEDSASALTGIITASSLDFFSANQLTDSGTTTMTVTGNARFATGSLSPITLGDLTEVLNFGSLTFVSTGAVAITEDSNTVLEGSSTAAVLVLRSAGSITDDADADLGVTGSASFTAGPITLGDQAGNVTNFGSLTFVGGDVSISEDSDAVLTGTGNTANFLNLSSAGSITDAAGTSLTVTSNATFSSTASLTLA